MNIVPYKNRTLIPSEEVRVYRNLSRPDGPWYSVVQRGRVVAHAREIALRDVRFVVQEAGRQRVIKTGVKNVHAFVIGTPAPYRVDAGENARRVGYNPFHAGAFVINHDGDGAGNRVARAKRAQLGPCGLVVTL